MRKLNKKQIEVLATNSQEMSFDQLSDLKDELKVSSLGISKILDFVDYTKSIVGTSGVVAALRHMDLSKFN